MDSLLSINPGLAIWTIVSFLLFVLLLRLFAWGPILQALEKREKRIVDTIESAEKARAESEELLLRQQEALKEAREEARAVIDRATTEAVKSGEEVARRARKEAEDLLERARTEIRNEEQRAVENVRREAVEVALEAATRLMRRSMKDDDHRKMVEEFIRETAEKAGESDT